MEEQKIEHFKTQIREAKADLDRVLKFMDPHNNGTNISGSHSYRGVAYLKISSARRHMEIAEIAKHRLQMEHLQLL